MFAMMSQSCVWKHCGSKRARRTTQINKFAGTPRRMSSSFDILPHRAFAEVSIGGQVLPAGGGTTGRSGLVGVCRIIRLPITPREQAIEYFSLPWRRLPPFYRTGKTPGREKISVREDARGFGLEGFEDLIPVPPHAPPFRTFATVATPKGLGPKLGPCYEHRREDHRARYAQGLPQPKPGLCRRTRSIDGMVPASQSSRLGHAGGGETGHWLRQRPQRRPRGIQYRRQQVPHRRVDQLCLPRRLHKVHRHAQAI